MLSKFLRFLHVSPLFLQCCSICFSPLNRAALRNTRKREREKERSSGSLHPNLDRRRSDVSATDRKVGTGRVYFRAPDILYHCSLSCIEKKRERTLKIYARKVGFIASIYKEPVIEKLNPPPKKKKKEKKNSSQSKNLTFNLSPSSSSSSFFGLYLTGRAMLPRVTMKRSCFNTLILWRNANCLLLFCHGYVKHAPLRFIFR